MVIRFKRGGRRFESSRRRHSHARTPFFAWLWRRSSVDRAPNPIFDPHVRAAVSLIVKLVCRAEPRRFAYLVRQVRLMQRLKGRFAILNPYARPGQPVCHLRIGGRSIRTSPRISVILHTTGTPAGRPAAGRKTGPPESTFTFVLADRPPSQTAPGGNHEVH